MMISFCQKNDLIIANTLFEKPDTKLATYKFTTTKPWDEISRGKYETLEYILIANRWKNTITNAESDMNSSIDSDHYPLNARMRIK